MRAITCTLACLALGSVAVVDAAPLDLSAPGAAVAAASAAPAAATTTDTAAAVRTLSLADAERIALERQPRIAAAEYAAIAARSSVSAARSSYFPHSSLYLDAVGANVEGTRIEAGGLNNPTIYDRAAGGVSISQLITDFGHTSNLVGTARDRARAAREGALATRERVLLNVDTDYYGALQAQAVLRVAMQTYETRKLLFDRVTLLARNKLKSALDVSFAKVAVAQSQLLLQKARSEADATMVALSTAIGYRAPRTFELVEPSADVAAPSGENLHQLVATAVANRPDLRGLRFARDAAARYARAERDARLPTISALIVGGGASRHDPHLPSHYAAGGIQFSIPLFAGGLYLARQHEAQWRAKEEGERLNAEEDRVVRDVHVAWLDLRNSIDQLHTTDDLAKNAQEAYDLAQARYRIGSESIVALSQAQLDLTSAQIADANARYDVYVERARLDYEIGDLR